MKKDLFISEIKRIHEIMKVNPLTILSEQPITRITRKLSNIIDDVGTQYLSGIRISNPNDSRLITQYSDFINELKNAAKQGEDEFKNLMNDFSKGNDIQKNIFTNINNRILNELGRTQSDLYRLAFEIENKKISLDGDNSLSSKEVDDIIQQTIYDTFYGGEGVRVAEFESNYVRDLFVNELKSNLNLDLDWRPKTPSSKKSKKSSLSFLQSYETQLRNIINKLNKAENEDEVISAIDDYLKIFDKVYTNYNLPKKGIFGSNKFDSFREELISNIKNSFDLNRGKVSSDIDTWVKFAKKQNRSQLKQFVDSISPEKISKEVKSTPTYEQFKKFWGYSVGSKMYVELINLFRKNAFNPTLTQKVMFVAIRFALVEIFHSYFAKELKKYHDIDIVSPFKMDYPDEGFTTKNVGAFISNEVTQNINLLMTVIAGVQVLWESEDREKDELSNYLETLKSTYGDFKINTLQKDMLHTFLKKQLEGIPQYNSLIKILDAVKEKKSKSEIDDIIPELGSAWKVLTNWFMSRPENYKFTEKDYLDMVYGLPIAIPGFDEINQIVPYNDKWYYITKEGFFEIYEFDSENPYITAKEGDEEPIDIQIKDIFNDSYNKYLPGYKPIDENPVVKSNSDIDLRKDFENDGYSDKIREKLIDGVGKLKVRGLKNLNNFKEYLINYGVNDISSVLKNIVHYELYDSQEDLDEGIPLAGVEDQPYYIYNNKPYRLVYANKDIPGVPTNGSLGDYIKKGNWYVKLESGWTPIIDLIDNKTTTTTNESPEQRWLSEHSNGSFKKLNPNKPTTWLYYTEPNNQGDRYIYKDNQFIQK